MNGGAENGQQPSATNSHRIVMLCMLHIVCFTLHIVQRSYQLPIHTSALHNVHIAHYPFILSKKSISYTKHIRLLKSNGGGIWSSALVGSGALLWWYLELSGGRGGGATPSRWGQPVQSCLAEMKSNG